ncbi:MAG: RNA methyltransferase [Proteobacteria bacterium]|nr:RNA methyltransferase [Pseudomonadota bacterium]MCP4917725.1 RNA methyltransferase [Pseudomonadota bacterium]
MLVQPLQPGNVGAVARAMANTGLRRLVLVDPPSFDMERARWMASGGKRILDEARFVATVEEAVEGCTWAVGTTARKRRWEWAPMDPPSLATQAFEREGPVAVLFGREDHGLDNDSLSWCQAALRIPTSGEPSLNLAQAVLLTCSALFTEARSRGFVGRDDIVRQGKRSGGGPVSERPRPPSELGSLQMQRRTVDMAVELLQDTPYMLGRNPEQVTVTLGQFLGRAQPTKVELEILLGMIKKTRWKLDHPDDG